MYVIKIMSGQNAGDADVAKGFKMVMVGQGDSFEFHHDQISGEPQLTVSTIIEGEPQVITYPVPGNCYVLSHTGKTVSTFWARSLWGEHHVPNEGKAIGGSALVIPKTTPTAPTLDKTYVDALRDTFQTHCEKPTRHANTTGMREAYDARGLTNTQAMASQCGDKTIDW